MNEPLDRHLDWQARFYAAPVDERQIIIAEELEEVAMEIRTGAITATTAPRWTDNPFAPGTMSLDFTRNQMRPETGA